MHSNFSDAARAARASLSVPPFSRDAILRRSYAREASVRIKSIAACVALLVGILAVGTGAASKMYDGVRLWLTGDKAAIVVHSFVVVRDPTPSDVAAIARSAAFPAIFPVGLSAHTRLWGIMYAPTQRPSTITVRYRSESGSFHGVTIAQTSTIDTNMTLLPSGNARPAFQPMSTWRIGNETVIVPAETDASWLARIRSQMSRSSPSASAAATEKMARTIVVLGAEPQMADRAQRVTSDAHAVLLGTQLVMRIPLMAQRHRPQLDTRVVHVSNVPIVHGAPDYAHATLTWPRRIVVSAKGVRAIAAVLKAAPAPRTRANTTGPAAVCHRVSSSNS